MPVCYLWHLVHILSTVSEHVLPFNDLHSLLRPSRMSSYCSRDMRVIHRATFPVIPFSHISSLSSCLRHMAIIHLALCFLCGTIPAHILPRACEACALANYLPRCTCSSTAFGICAVIRRLCFLCLPRCTILQAISMICIVIC